LLARLRPAARLDELQAELRHQSEAVAELERRLEDTQALVARAYEMACDWPAKLEVARAQPDYAAAWEEPEPLVSVRIATYENAQVLCERTLASVCRQSYARWECIVVGDAVTDDTEARIAAIGDPRIRFVNLPFRGPYPDDALRRWRVAGTEPMNRGAREAAGRWVAPLDHDDEWEADHLEALLARARETRAELVYGKLRVCHAADGRVLPNVVGAWPLQYGQFGFQGAIYHAGLRCFEVDPHARFAGEPGDWNLARRMWEAGVRFAFLDRIVTTYYWAPVDAQGRAWLASVLGDA
jgi:glycosyltransferase involved in cell wall biosynthesis